MSDVRLIDANALVKEIESVHCKGCNNYNGAMCRACEWMDAMDYIEDAPTIDAQPVKHGHWVETEPDPEDLKIGIDFRIECSECHDENSHLDLNDLCEITGKTFWKSKFCPNCGVKMDGGSDTGRKRP